jgi:hypothetical protein
LRGRDSSHATNISTTAAATIAAAILRIASSQPARLAGSANWLRIKPMSFGMSETICALATNCAPMRRARSANAPKAAPPSIRGTAARPSVVAASP